MNKLIVVLLSLILLIVVVFFGYYFFTTNQKGTTDQTPTPTVQTAPEITTAPTFQPQPAQEEETSNVPSGWLTYTNQEYGFEISYPASFEALDDANNLYGWPNGIVLICSGGQSYDLPIEVWDDPADYQAKYASQMGDLVVKQVGNQYITLINMNHLSEVDQIISTFTY